MAKLPMPPPEVPRQDSLDGLAPKFRTALEAIIRDVEAEGWQVRVFETIRTNERQEYLYGFGREYDDGRGPVTRSPTATKSWHIYGLAADLVQDDATPWVAPQAFWQAIGKAAEKNGCTWGGTWDILDLPHVQLKKCPTSPSTIHQRLLKEDGVESVWGIVDAL